MKAQLGQKLKDLQKARQNNLVTYKSLNIMNCFHFKTICKDGITRTCVVTEIKYHDAFLQAKEIFDKFHPEHGYINPMSKRSFMDFHNIYCL